jgi:hypothetical protein
MHPLDAEEAWRSTGTAIVVHNVRHNLYLTAHSL